MFSHGSPISDRTPTQSLLVISITIFSGFLLIGPVVGVMLSALVFEHSMDSYLKSGVIDPTMTKPLILIQGVATFLGLILFPIIHITRLEHKSLRPLIANRTHLTQVLLLVSLLGLAFPLAISPITEWNAHVHFPSFMHGFEEWARQKEDVLTQATKMLTSFDTVGGLIVTLFVVAVLPAIGEELAFRGMIQKELLRGTNNAHLAIWVSAFVFSAIHVQFFGFIPRLLLGALFGYLYYWSDNLLVPIVAHFVNNAFGVISIYLYNIKVISTDFEDVESVPWRIVIVCLVVAGLLITMVRNIYLKASATTSNNSY
jgi:membrane protease YdiL (CAAX protease family)